MLPNCVKSTDDAANNNCNNSHITAQQQQQTTYTCRFSVSALQRRCVVVFVPCCTLTALANASQSLVAERTCELLQFFLLQAAVCCMLSPTHLCVISSLLCCCFLFSFFLYCICICNFRISCLTLYTHAFDVKRKRSLKQQMHFEMGYAWSRGCIHKVGVIKTGCVS